MQEDAWAVSEAHEAIALPPLSMVPAEPIRPFDRSPSMLGLHVDLSGLVDVCRRHESKWSLASARKRAEQHASSPKSSNLS